MHCAALSHAKGRAVSLNQSYANFLKHHKQAQPIVMSQMPSSLSWVGHRDNHTQQDSHFAGIQKPFARMGIVGTELETVALNNGTFSLKTADELQIACQGLAVSDD